MIELRRAKERRHARRRDRAVWLTFPRRGGEDPLAGGFGALRRLDEIRLPPREDVPRLPFGEAEVVTYVREGALSCKGSKGRSGVLCAGEFRRRTAGQGVRRRETNASPIDGAHLFRILLRPSAAGLEPDDDQKRFSAAERRGALCVIASPDGRRGSLRVRQDALIYSAMFLPGQHLIHELSPARRAWLHVVQGEVTLGDVVLTAGDGAGVTGERAVALTARAETEILLIDLGAPVAAPPPKSRRGRMS